MYISNTTIDNIASTEEAMKVISDFLATAEGIASVMEGRIPEEITKITTKWSIPFSKDFITTLYCSLSDEYIIERSDWSSSSEWQSSSDFC